MDQTKELILRYFHSWQQDDYSTLRECLDDDFEVNLNGLTINNADTFVKISESGDAWQEVTLIDAIYTDDKAAIMYEGINGKGLPVRVGEMLSIRDGKIISSVATLFEGGQ